MIKLSGSQGAMARANALAAVKEAFHIRGGWLPAQRTLRSRLESRNGDSKKFSKRIKECHKSWPSWLLGVNLQTENMVSIQACSPEY